MPKHYHRWVHKRSTNGMRTYTRMVERECDICGLLSFKTLPLNVPTLNKNTHNKNCIKENFSSIRKLQDKIGNLMNELVNAVYRIEGKHYKADLAIVPVNDRSAAQAHIGDKCYSGSRASLEKEKRDELERDITSALEADRLDEAHSLLEQLRSMSSRDTLVVARLESSLATLRLLSVKE